MKSVRLEMPDRLPVRKSEMLRFSLETTKPSVGRICRYKQTVSPAIHKEAQRFFCPIFCGLAEIRSAGYSAAC